MQNWVNPFDVNHSRFFMPPPPSPPDPDRKTVLAAIEGYDRYHDFEPQLPSGNIPSQKPARKRPPHLAASMFINRGQPPPVESIPIDTSKEVINREPPPYAPPRHPNIPLYTPHQDPIQPPPYPDWHSHYHPHHLFESMLSQPGPRWRSPCMCVWFVAGVGVHFYWR